MHLVFCCEVNIYGKILASSLPVFLEEFAAGGGVISVALDKEADAARCVGECVVEDVGGGAALLDEGVADEGHAESRCAHVICGDLLIEAECDTGCHFFLF